LMQITYNKTTIDHIGNDTTFLHNGEAQSNDISNKKHHSSFIWDDLKSIAELAMQHARYSDAADIYSTLIRCRPNDGDILHAHAASFLGRNKFRHAQRLWDEAYHLCPDHDGIALQRRKRDAYRTLQEHAEEEFNDEKDYKANTLVSQKCAGKGDHGNVGNIEEDDSLPGFFSYLNSTCFVTKPSQALLTPKECKQVIDWTEKEAQNRPGKGWTTDRHYDVPTTDLPVHEIPSLLPFFNDLLRCRLRPLLAKQFGEDVVGKEGRNVEVHDAFVVKYDAKGGQHHLPLHRDESTHSFTIALNDIGEYMGGGTYITKLGRSVRAELGGVVSFRGDQLLHGGDPIVQGVRYIIAAFCYIGEERSTSKREHFSLHSTKNSVSKRLKQCEKFHLQKKSLKITQEKVGFSFSFKI